MINYLNNLKRYFIKYKKLNQNSKNKVIFLDTFLRIKNKSIRLLKIHRIK